MKPNFEIKYLELDWYDKNTLTKITESINSLAVEYDEKLALFQVETTIYPKLDGIINSNLAIRYLDKSSHPPYLIRPNGEKEFFTEIKDPDTGYLWWIIKHKWHSERKQWVGISINIVGKVELSIDNKRCDIIIHGSDFSYDELEHYLQTFKDDLWELILDEKSMVISEAKETNSLSVNNKTIECINNLIKSAENILINPKAELKEIQALKLRKVVKPVNRTFMEIVTKSNQRLLTSRATEASYNVAENQYTLFALERCYRIIKQVVILAKNKSSRYGITIKKLNNQLNSFSNSIIVDRNFVVDEYKKTMSRNNLQYWNEYMQNRIINSGVVFTKEALSTELHIKIESKSKFGYFISIFVKGEWLYNKNKNNKYGKNFILNLDGQFNPLIEIFKPGMELIVNCKLIQEKKPKSIIVSLQNIHSIKLISWESLLTKINQSLLKIEESAKNLARNGWIKILSRKEMNEQEKEKKSLNNRIDFYKKNRELSMLIYDSIEPKFRSLKKIISRLKNLGITPLSYFPNSMTFVQNPHYQGVHNGYKFLRNITDLNEDELLIYLEEIDKIGLVNMPLIYERWVLIQIILILKDTFRFKLEANWKYKIIEAIKTAKKDISIYMHNQQAHREINLWYEKILPNNKRPDFILDLTWHSGNDPDKNNVFKKRFVLDAKFYDKKTFDKAGGLIEKINELYIYKNYAQDCQNPVFLIHPCDRVIESKVTPQNWGQYSFLGEIAFNDDNYPQHNYGAIYLNPIDKVFYADELQRLIGLFLQYKLELSNTSNYDTDRTQAIPICIRCGSTDIQQLHKTNSYLNNQGMRVERTEKSVWMLCNECQQFQSYNHCANDGTRLIKNGLYWTYHSARSIEPFNVKCPNCGEWGAW